MTLKAIDLQLAVHKNVEAAQMQKQLQDKPVHDQSVLASGQLKTDSLNRRRSERLSKTENEQMNASKDGKPKGHPQVHGAVKRSESEQAKDYQTNHPYKGKHLDLSL